MEATSRPEVEGASVLFKALAGEDELGAIIRAHIYIENEIEKFIVTRVKHPSELDLRSYATKVSVALACGLRRNLKSPLKEVGKLRNKFAHEIGKVISVDDADKLFKSFSPLDQGIFSNVYERMRKNSDRNLGSLTELDPRDRVTLYLVVLWGALVSERIRRSSEGAL